MIVALGLLSINILPYINAIIAKLSLFCETKATRILVLKNLIAHKERNQMTSLMISLTLGFVIFLNVVCQIPFAKEMHDKIKEKGSHSILIDKGNLPMF
jgi:uncharacterized membrane protein YjdF